MELIVASVSLHANFRLAWIDIETGFQEDEEDQTGFQGDEGMLMTFWLVLQVHLRLLIGEGRLAGTTKIDKWSWKLQS